MAVSEKKINTQSSYYLTEFFCRISIKGVDFFPQNITTLHVRENIFTLVPTLELDFQDDGLFTEKFPLEEGDDIKLELSRSDKKESTLSMTFSLLSYSVTNADGDRIRISNISLIGWMKSEKLFNPSQTRSFRNKSSVEVLKSIGSECGFNVVSKVNTSDNMTWLQIGANNFTFIDQVLSKSYRSDDVLLCAVNRGGTFTVTSLATEVKKGSPIKCVFDPSKALANVDSEKDTKKVLYFNDFEIRDIAGYSNLTGGYGASFTVYDFDKAKEIVENGNSPFLSRFNEKRVDKVKEHSVSLDAYVQDNRNVHQNYFRAKVQNWQLVKDFFKVSIFVHVNPSNSINLFDVVEVIFPSFTEATAVNEVLSGKYMVGGIVHQASSGGLYRMGLVLYRSGFNESSYQTSYSSVRK